MITVKMDQVPVCRFVNNGPESPAAGPTTMPAKMIKLIPFPMPRSVICSPIHMMKAVPVVSVIITMKRKPHPGSATIWGPVPPPERSSAIAVMNPWKRVSATVR